jgi:NitT/TauT family transport system substrate-binding protein
MKNIKALSVFAGLALIGMMISSCAGSAVPAPGVVKETVIVEVTQPPLVPVKLTTGWVFTGGSTAMLTLGESRGYFEEEGIAIDIVRGFGSSDVVTKIAAGTYEAGTGFFPELVRAKAQNPEMDVIALLIAYDGGPDSIVGPKTSGVETVEDLEGKRITAIPNSTAQLTFDPFAQAVGLDPDSVQWVEVGGELLATAVIQGDADLSAQFGSSAISNYARLGYSRDELVVFKFSDYVTLYGNALLVRKSWAESHPEAARGLVRAYIRSLIDSHQNPEEATDTLMVREPLLNRDIEYDDLIISLEEYYFTDKVLEEGVGYHTNEDIANAIQMLAEPFGLERVPAVEEVYDPQYLPPLEERMVSE